MTLAWLGTWAHRIEITLDNTNVDSDLSNFPVLLYLSAASGIGDVDVSAIFDELTADANRKKIAVTTDDGTTQCYVEIEKWDDANEKAWLWVKVPSVTTAVVTTLFLYYDSTAAANTTYIGDTTDAVTHNVWDANYQLVQHLADGDLYDSTSNAFNGTNSGTADIAGQIGQGRDFELSEADFISFGDVADINGTSFTASIIYKFESLSIVQRLCQKRGSGAGGATPGWMLAVFSDNYWSLTLVDGGDGNYVQIGAAKNTGIETGVFHQADLVFDTTSGNLKLYIDGVQVSSGTDADLIGADLSNARHLTLGCSWDAAETQAQIFDGVLDEFRFSNSVRSVDWIKATVYSNTDALATFGVETAWLGTWGQRIKIELSPTNVDATLTNFPVCLNISATSGIGDVDVSAVFDELTSDANRTKIAVTTGDGETECYVEIELWDDANETAVLWVKVPSLDDTVTTVLYLYYDATQDANTTYVGDTTDAVTHNVWDANFVSVYHLAQDPNGDGAGAIKDSTSNANDLTPAGTMLTEDLVSAAPGYGIDFDGSNDRLDNAAPAGLPSSTLTFEMVAIAEAVGESATTGMSIADSGSSNNFITLQVYNGYVRQVQDGTLIFSGGTLLVEGNTFSGTFTRVGDAERYIFTNGADKTSNITDDAYPSGTDTLSIGGVADTTPEFFGGIITEARFSDIVRADAWIKATHYSNTDALMAWGSEETAGGEPASYTITMASGTYALTGTAMSFLRNYNLAMGAGAYTLAGTAIGLKKVIRIIIGSGSYALMGSDITLSVIAILLILNSIIEQEITLDSEINQEKTLASLIEQETIIDAQLIKGWE